MHAVLDSSSHSRGSRYLWGFSAIEILIVVAILGLILTIAIPAYSSYTDKKNNSQAKADIVEIQTAIEKFYLINNRFPDSLEDIGKNNMRDPWNNPYYYVNVTKEKNKSNVRKDKNLTPVNSDYDLYSAGKDKSTHLPFTAQASRDDVVRCNNGTYIGLVEEY